jgi:hypothetical protein
MEAFRGSYDGHPHAEIALDKKASDYSMRTTVGSVFSLRYGESPMKVSVVALTVLRIAGQRVAGSSGAVTCTLAWEKGDGGVRARQGGIDNRKKF